MKVNVKLISGRCQGKQHFPYPNEVRITLNLATLVVRASDFVHQNMSKSLCVAISLYFFRFSAYISLTIPMVSKSASRMESPICTQYSINLAIFSGWLCNVQERKKSAYSFIQNKRIQALCGF